MMSDDKSQTTRRGTQLIAIGGIWVRNKGSDHVEILAEVDGSWRLVATERIGDGEVSNIIEPGGIFGSPKDTAHA